MPLLANRVLELTMRLGVVRFGLLIAAFEILFSMLVTVVLRGIVVGELHWVDYLRPVLFGLIIAPWLALFFTYLIKQLGESRDKLAQAHSKQQALNAELKRKVSELNREIDERHNAEAQKQQAIRYLQREVAERRDTQNKLRDQAVQLRSLIDSSPDLIFYRNKDGVFSGCNLAYEQLVNLSEADLIGKTPEDVYEDQIAAQVRVTDYKVLNDLESLTYEQWMTYPDGRKAMFEFRKVPFNDARGNLQGLFGFGRDITERKQAANALEQAARDKTTFISTISHELRTPLNGIVGLSRIMRDSELNDEQHDFINTIYLSAVTLGNIFNDIIDLDKLEREQLEVAPMPLHITELIADVRAVAALMCRDKKLYFDYQQRGDLPAVVEVDGTRLRQVLWNLLGNAVKFTQQGQVGLSLDISPAKNGKISIEFRVSDTGVGIPKAELDKIFAMYYQVSGQGKTKAVGTGIGLSVSQRLSQAMGGSINVTSEEGKGSCFTVSLTLPVLSEDQLPDATDIELPALHVLLVEDIELNVVVARSVLENLGCTVDVAMNGTDALRMAQEDDYDVFFLDIQLPDMTGFDIAESLMNDPNQRLRETPRIALTANVIRDKQEYLNKGMQDAVSKPIDVGLLTMALARAFGCVDEPVLSAPAPLLDAPSGQEESVLDTNFVGQMHETLGSELFAKSIDMFEQLMPDYVETIHNQLLSGDDKAVAEIAHKVKGAAGSVGLQRVQKLASQAQDLDHPAWEQNIQEWAEGIAKYYPLDVETLRQQLVTLDS
ncbi:aerobic respiration two-component sensor histidine kinase ArcB [Neiella marina]|uniref:Aerobic respiration control sensor protein n=1 Tax=Neiella holothuriorum TaxID=2870530 RepID=A0ABS7EH82_9GAMM|nr:aerobic respiration two-component sensor histidine kinase ArcB [Neiella holothuriorum]MBW8191141.1 aerobic respiration two-component sensor histidine kinase ArcB [Neiella holothuriorum]